MTNFRNSPEDCLASLENVRTSLYIDVRKYDAQRELSKIQLFILGTIKDMIEVRVHQARTYNLDGDIVDNAKLYLAYINELIHRQPAPEEIMQRRTA